MSKIKLVPVPNITKRELMTALMDGRRFSFESSMENISMIDDIVHWDGKNGYNPVRLGTIPWNWRGFKSLHELVEQNWYEDPEMVGKPVKVRDHTNDAWEYDIFEEYVFCDHLSFKCSDTSYEYAEPLTAADLYQEQV